MINLLEWFVVSVYQVINGLHINPQGKTDVNNFLSSECTAVNHLAQLQARNLGSNATIRREAFLKASVLGREESHYLRSRGIGCLDLLGREGNDAMKRASEEKRTSLLFQSVNGRRATSASTSSHRSNVSIPPRTTSSCKTREIRPLEFHTARNSKKPPTAAPAPHLNVKAGRGCKIVVTNRYEPKSKILGAGDPRTAPSGSASLEFRAGVEHTDYVFLRKIRCTGRVSHRAGDLPTLYPVPLPLQLSPTSEKALCLRREITPLLEKRAIEELFPTSLSPGFYSRIFLVPEKDGGWRPVFDLKSLNHFVCKKKFKMTTYRVVTVALHHGDWIVSVDLKDIYFYIPIHRKYTAIDACSALPQQGTTGSEFFSIQSHAVRSDLGAQGIHESDSTHRSSGTPIGSYREIAIAIESEAGDSLT